MFKAKDISQIGGMFYDVFLRLQPHLSQFPKGECCALCVAFFFDVLVHCVAVCCFKCPCLCLFPTAADDMMSVFIVSGLGWWLFAPSLLSFLSPHLVPSVQGKELHSPPNRAKHPLWLHCTTRASLRPTEREISDDATA